MTIEEGKDIVRSYLAKFTTPEKPNIWLGEPIDADELGFTIDASVYGPGENPEDHKGRFELDFASRTVDYNLIG